MPRSAWAYQGYTTLGYSQRTLTTLSPLSSFSASAISASPCPVFLVSARCSGGTPINRAMRVRAASRAGMTVSITNFMGLTADCLAASVTAETTRAGDGEMPAWFR